MSQMIDKIEASVAFDESGNIPRGETGERVPPADPAENTAPPAPSPDPAPAPADKAAPVEKKTDSAAPVTEPAPGTTPAKAPLPDESKFTPDEETALKEKHSKPGETGNEWQIRAAREGHKLRKQFEPVNDVMERIGSPDRARRGLELTADLADPEVPIANAVSKMTALSSSRFEELHNHLYNAILDDHPDLVATDLIGEKTTAAELKEGLALLRSGAKGVQPQSTTTDKTPTADVKKPEGMSDDDWEDLTTDPGLKPAYDLLKAQQAQIAAAAAKPAETKEPELHPAEKRLQEIETQQRREAMEKGWEEIKTEYGKLYDSAFKVVDDGLRDLGLVPDPAKDDERTIKLKTKTADRISEAVYLEFEGPNGPNRTKEDPEGQEDWSLCTEEQKLNRKLIKTVHKLMLGDPSKGISPDPKAANDYLERIQAQVDLAFQRAEPPEMELYNAAMLQSTTPKPRDGSDHKRPELVGGTAPGGTPANKTPWLDPGYRQPGETNRDAMMRYLESQAA